MTDSSDNLIKIIKSDTNSFKYYANSDFNQQEKKPNQGFSLIELNNRVTLAPISAKAKSRSNNISSKAMDQFSPEFRYLVIAQHDAGQAALINKARIFHSKQNQQESQVDFIQYKMIINNISTNIFATFQSYSTLNTEITDISFDNIDVIFFLFDANKESNIYHLESYINALNIPVNLHKVIVGTQIREIRSYDQNDFDELDSTLSHAETFANQNKMEYLEISANAMTTANLFTQATHDIAAQMFMFQPEFQKSLKNAINNVDKYLVNRAANENEYIGLFKQGYSRGQKLNAAEALKQTLLGKISYMDLLASIHMGPLTQSNSTLLNVYNVALPILMDLNLIQLENFQLPEIQPQQRSCK